MKKVISLLIALGMLISFIPFTVVPTYASETKTVDTGDAETDRILTDYGFDVSRDSVEGYDPDNGNVENSPYGTAWMDSYTLMEAVYLNFSAANNSNSGNYIEGNTDVFGSEARPSGSVNATDSINGIGIYNKHSVTASGDFSRDSRSNGAVVLYIFQNTYGR